ncbi:hypothetical protein BC937DRAFT_94969, partial [Endogone sp. FLAS-F59071]
FFFFFFPLYSFPSLSLLFSLFFSSPPPPPSPPPSFYTFTVHVQMQSQASLGSLTPLWRYLELERTRQPNSDSTTLQPSTLTMNDAILGDFGGLWRFLETEKRSWATAVPALNNNDLNDNDNELALQDSRDDDHEPSAAVVVEQSSEVQDVVTQAVRNSTKRVKAPKKSKNGSTQNTPATPTKPHLLPKPSATTHDLLSQENIISTVVNTNSNTIRMLIKVPTSSADTSNCENISQRSIFIELNAASENRLTEKQDVQTLSTKQHKTVRFKDSLGMSLVEPDPLHLKDQNVPNRASSSVLRLPSPFPLLSPAASARPVHVFIDHSNIAVGLYNYCPQTTSKTKKPLMNYQALFGILERNRVVARRVLVASYPLFQKLDEAESAGYEVCVLRRVAKPYVNSPPYNHRMNKTHAFSSSSDTDTDMDSSPSKWAARAAPSATTRGEQCVDELLQLKIMESLLDYQVPATLVLATGDGKQAEFSQGGFYGMVVRALQRGWRVEVVSWKMQLSKNFLEGEEVRNYTSMKKKNGDAYEVVYLDQFAKELGA